MINKFMRISVGQQCYYYHDDCRIGMPRSPDALIWVCVRIRSNMHNHAALAAGFFISCHKRDSTHWIVPNGVFLLNKLIWIIANIYIEKGKQPEQSLWNILPLDSFSSTSWSHYKYISWNLLHMQRFAMVVFIYPLTLRDYLCHDLLVYQMILVQVSSI